MAHLAKRTCLGTMRIPLCIVYMTTMDGRPYQKILGIWLETLALTSNIRLLSGIRGCLARPDSCQGLYQPCHSALSYPPEPEPWRKKRIRGRYLEIPRQWYASVHLRSGALPMVTFKKKMENNLHREPFSKRLLPTVAALFKFYGWDVHQIC